MTTTASDVANAATSMWDGAQGLLGAAGGLAYANEISNRGQDYAGQMGQLAGQLQNDSAFKGYGVNTGLANSTIGPDGTMNLGIGRDQGMADAGNAGFNAGMGAMGNAQGILGNNGNGLTSQATGGFGAGQQGLSGLQANGMNASNQMMQQSMQSQAGREQDIYGRAMAMQQPMLDQQRAQMNAREYAQGRSGIRGSQFGGTGEDAAMARAQAQAQNGAAFQSMGMAQQEQMQQANMANMYGQQGLGAAGLNANIGQMYGNLGSANQAGALNNAQAMGQIGANQAQMGMQQYGQSYMGMQNQLAAMQNAQAGGNMAQTGQLTGTGYAAQLGLGGVQTAVNADKAASELYGNVAAAMMNNANDSAGGESWLGKLFG